MDIKVKFKGIDYRTGNKRKFKHTFETPIDFVEKHSVNRFKEFLLKNESLSDKEKVFVLEMDDKVITDVYEQAMEWVDDRDNIDIIHDYNLNCILDYEILAVGGHNRKEESKRLKKAELTLVQNQGDKRIVKDGEFELHKPDTEALKVITLVDNMISSEQLKNDFLACYKEMYPAIKKMGYKKQFEIVLGSTNVAYTSSLNTLKNLDEYNKRLNEIPRAVWKLQFSTNTEYMKSYMDGTLTDSQKESILSLTPRQDVDEVSRKLGIAKQLKQ